MANLNLKVLIKAVAELKPVTQMAAALGRLNKPARAAGMVFRSVGRDIVTMGRIGVAGIAAYSAAIVGAMGALFRYGRTVANASEEMEAAAQRAGMASRSYQRLAFAADRSEISTEKFDSALKGFNLRIDAASRGNDRAAEGFARLGIRLRDAHGQLKPTEALLEEAADKLSALPDGARKSALAMALFGEAGADMLPMLDKGGQAIRALGDHAERTGQVMSEQFARDASEFNDKVDDLKGNILGLGNTLMGGLFPQLTQIIGKLQAFIDANRPEIIRLMTEVTNQLVAATPGLINGLGDIIKVIQDLATIIGPVVAALGGFHKVLDLLAVLMIGRLAIAIWTAVQAVWALNGAMYANPIGLVIISIAGLIAAGWMLYRNWDKVVAWIKKAWSGIVSFFTDLGKKMKAAFKLAIDALWLMLPPWLRMIFRGARFVLKVAGSGLGGGAPGGGAPAAPSAPNPAAPGTRRPGPSQVDVNVLTRHEGPPRVSVRASGDAIGSVSRNYRGGGVD